MKLLLVLLSLTALGVARCISRPEDPATSSLARLEPPTGAYYGVNLDWERDSAIGYSRRLGMPAAAYVAFFPFPFGVGDTANLDAFIDQVADQRAMALITLEPHSGLDRVTGAVAHDFAERLAEYNRRGVPVLVRFGHEMNGSWYPWSQRPAEYVRAFRTLADAVHRTTTLSAMLWAPNYGGGYPFAGGPYRASERSSDFHLLDTNQDGRLDMSDDMYAPYYPGDDAVDWVGMSVYHWGDQYPWGENETPEAGKFVSQITGAYSGLDGDHRSAPDFYQVYVEQRRKPMAVTETAALYNPQLQGDAELAIKQAWWRQVFSPEVARDLPGIKMINWFEWRKFESEIGAVIDWTVASDPVVLRAYLDDLPSSRLLFATDLPDVFSGTRQQGAR